MLLLRESEFFGVGYFFTKCFLLGCFHTVTTMTTEYIVILQLSTETDVKLTLTHETPVHHYIDDVTFTFADGDTADSCKIHVSRGGGTLFSVLLRR